MGNLRSVQKAFEHVGLAARITRDPRTIAEASHLVLPGVGAFPDAMRNLNRFGLIEPIHRAIEQTKPFLGICLGLQLLFSESEEFGRHPGLGVIKGRVVRFSREAFPSLKVPHMGWNTLTLSGRCPIFSGLPDRPSAYFVHSYYAVPEDPQIIAAETEYGPRFAAAVSVDRLFACQFHPEKSQAVGLSILKRFGRIQ
jgi:glutamine amidotransferase